MLAELDPAGRAIEIVVENPDQAHALHNRYFA